MREHSTVWRHRLAGGLLVGTLILATPAMRHAPATVRAAASGPTAAQLADADPAPGWITTGPDGNLWFNEDGANKIARYNPVTGAIDAFAVPTPNAFPAEIVAGPDGALWFTENTGDHVARITTSGTITEFPILHKNAGLNSIKVGPDGNLWFLETGVNAVARMTLQGKISEYPIPTAQAYPDSICVGPDGNLYFAEQSANKIGRINPSTGAIVEFKVPTADSGPSGIVAGPDHNLWILETNANKIARMTTSGQFAETSVPAPLGILTAIIDGPDGKLWFTPQIGSAVGMVATDGTISWYPVPSDLDPGMTGITVGPDRAVWATEMQGNKLVRITRSGTPHVREIPLPGAGNMPLSDTVTPDGSVWFTEQYRDRIGRLEPGGTITQYQLATGSAPDSIAAGPDGVWFTEHLADKVGHLSQAGTLSEFTLPMLPGFHPKQIVRGADGAYWVTETTGDALPGRFTNTIWRFTTPGHVAQFRIGSTHVPAIAAAPDGTIWFVDTAKNAIAHLDGDGQLHDYPLPGPRAAVYGLAVDAQGAVWFTDANNNLVGRLLPATGAIKDFPVPTKQAFPERLVAMPTGIWFNENGATKLGHVSPDGRVSEIALPPGVAGAYYGLTGTEGMAAAPDGTLWVTAYYTNQLIHVTPSGAVATTFIPIGSTTNSSEAHMAAQPTGAAPTPQPTRSAAQPAITIGNLGLAHEVSGQLQYTDTLHQGEQGTFYAPYTLNGTGSAKPSGTLTLVQNGMQIVSVPMQPGTFSDGKPNLNATVFFSTTHPAGQITATMTLRLGSAVVSKSYTFTLAPAV